MVGDALLERVSRISNVTLWAHIVGAVSVSAGGVVATTDIIVVDARIADVDVIGDCCGGVANGITTVGYGEAAVVVIVVLSMVGELPLFLEVLLAVVPVVFLRGLLPPMLLVLLLLPLSLAVDLDLLLTMSLTVDVKEAVDNVDADCDVFVVVAVAAFEVTVNDAVGVVIAIVANAVNCGDCCDVAGSVLVSTAAIVSTGGIARIY